MIMDLGVQLCFRQETEGALITSSDCARMTIPKSTSSLTTTYAITAIHVFLGGQKILNQPSPTRFLTKSSSGLTVPTPSVPIPPGSNNNDAQWLSG